MQLAEFQRRAVGKLMMAMESDKREIVLKSCTGSGKTIILTYFMDEYRRGNPGLVFIWLTPGKGDLEEQSKEKMDRYIRNSRSKLLGDVLSDGFLEGDACFINWEKLTKRGNNALKDGEQLNFMEQVDRALKEGLRFVVVVDESHQNDTVKAQDILKLFHAEKIIRCSATPREYNDAWLIEIPERDVIADGLIKKVLAINQDFAQDISTDSQVDYLLGHALDRQRALANEFKRRNVAVNPLIIVQLPNRSEILQDQVERWFAAQNICYENGLLAIWLSERKQNLEGIEKNSAPSVAVLIKQAVATGWDCPRAHILVKLRDNMGEVFEIQTIGRIRRMPEARHYESDLLDSCYLYTFDEKFEKGVKFHLDKGALDAATLTLRPEFQKMTLPCEQKSGVAEPRDAKRSLDSILAWYRQRYGAGSRTTENKKRLEAEGYIFEENIRQYTISGRIVTLDEAETTGLNVVTLHEKLNTHDHGRLYHHRVGKIALQTGFTYDQMNTMLRRLFDRSAASHGKSLLSLDTRMLYAFVLNNYKRLQEDIRSAMSAELNQQRFKSEAVVVSKFTFPPQCLFTYDSRAKSQHVMEKNVYQGYLLSAEPRSAPEKRFERFCEQSRRVRWLYRNGDKGAEYFSIVYSDNGGKQRSFYPDYLIGVDDEVWVVETKGGFDRMGKSEDIDVFTEKKFNVLRDFLQRYGMKGGIVREDKRSQELCICMDQYSDNISDDHWVLLDELL